MKVGLKLLLVLALQVSCLLAEQFSFEGLVLGVILAQKNAETVFYLILAIKWLV